MKWLLVIQFNLIVLYEVVRRHQSITLCGQRFALSGRRISAKINNNFRNNESRNHRIDERGYVKLSFELYSVWLSIGHREPRSVIRRHMLIITVCYELLGAISTVSAISDSTSPPFYRRIHHSQRQTCSLLKVRIVILAELLHL